MCIRDREYWQRLQGLLPPDSEAARQIETNIAQARAMASAGSSQPATAPGPAAATAPATPSSTPAASQATAPGRLSGQARIAPALMAQVQPTDTVFILARPASGSRMPLAVLRLRAADLPRAFTLDDSNAMSPQAPLSSAGRVRVEIRISRSGTAMPQAGDLGGTPVEVDVPASGLEVVADTVLR